jgi:hypothetical protein
MNVEAVVHFRAERRAAPSRPTRSAAGLLARLSVGPLGGRISVLAEPGVR